MTGNLILANMTVAQTYGSLICGIPGKKCETRAIKNDREVSIETFIQVRHYRYLTACDGRGLRSKYGGKSWRLTCNQHSLDHGFFRSNKDERLASKRRCSSEGIFQWNSTSESRPLIELIKLSVPAIAGQAIEPLAQLMETAYIGRLGPWSWHQGVAISIFNIISKVFNIPLLSVATSFVAEDVSRNASKESTSEVKKLLPSVSTALVLAVGIGVFEAAALYLGSGLFLNTMGISSESSMRIPAEHFLSLRAIGTPAVVVSMVIQGIFRGFKDTKTPVFCLGKRFTLSELAIYQLYFLSYTYILFSLGVAGAAISTVASQYIVTFSMIWYLNKRTVIRIPNLKNLHLGGYLRSGGFLLGRTLASVMTITFSTSMAARQGPLAMAAHQICLQVWLSVSLLADALAGSAQALIASSFAKKDYSAVKEMTYSALKTGLFTGISLAAILGVSFGSLATLFTKDAEVLDIVRSGLLFVSASQPVNALAYVFDGLHYGVSDFLYAAGSMMVVGAISSAFLFYATSIIGLSGVWLGLTLFMGLRIVAGYLRYIIYQKEKFTSLHRNQCLEPRTQHPTK
ncbi:hypothetical protein AAG906_015838 [Vitis piasezkii]